jgi:hypothetical protein
VAFFVALPALPGSFQMPGEPPILAHPRVPYATEVLDARAVEAEEERVRRLQRRAAEEGYDDGLRREARAGFCCPFCRTSRPPRVRSKISTAG